MAVLCGFSTVFTKDIHRRGGDFFRDHQIGPGISAIPVARGKQSILGMGTGVLGLQLPAVAHAGGGFEIDQSGLRARAEALFASQ